MMIQRRTVAAVAAAMVADYCCQWEASGRIVNGHETYCRRPYCSVPMRTHGRHTTWTHCWAVAELCCCYCCSYYAVVGALTYRPCSAVFRRWKACGGKAAAAAVAAVANDAAVEVRAAAAAVGDDSMAAAEVAAVAVDVRQ